MAVNIDEPDSHGIPLLALCFFRFPILTHLTETLEESTAALTARLLEEITKAHSACLSKIVEVTARSQSYIDVADRATDKFARLPILTDDFDKELAAYPVFVAAKQRNIDGLCGEYQAITNEIKELQREALAISPTVALTQQRSLGYKEFEEVDVDVDATGEAHLENAVGKLREIETEWVGHMHNNERVGSTPRALVGGYNS